MDNANKIDSNLTHREVALFLGDELKNEQSENVVTYDLVEEYAKTAQHKKKFVWKLLALCFFIVGIGTFTTVGMVSNSNHKIVININSFNDLNLRSLLSSVSRVQTLYENAVKNKATLEENLSDELNQAAQKREMDLFTLNSVASVATKNSISERKIKIDLDYNTAVQNIKNEYEPKIKKADEEIKKYQSQVASYDSEELSRAKNAESSIDSTKQLHDMEMKHLEEKYEKKIKELHAQLLNQQIKAAEEQRNAVEEVRKIYQAKIDLLDPKAREESKEQNKIILDAGIKNKVESSALWDSVKKLSFKEADYTQVLSTSAFSESIKRTEKELGELRTIAYRFQPIPMENSIKDYVPAMIHQSYQIANDLAKSGSKMKDDLDAFALIIEENIDDKADGVILSTKNAPEFSVYVKKASLAKVQGEKSVQVEILNGSKAMAEGTLSKKNEEFTITQRIPQTEEEVKTPPYTPATGDRIRIVIEAK